MAVSAVLGFCLAHSSKRGGYFVAYGMVLVGTLALAVFGLVRIFILKANEGDHLSRLWNTASDATVHAIQSQGQCCGFASYFDRIQLPCTKFDPAVGCYGGFMRDRYLNLLNASLGPSILLVSVLLLAILLDIGMLLVIYYEQEDEKMSISKRQPFDAWHRAVFQ